MVYTPAVPMVDPLDKTLKELVQEGNARGRVLLGVVYFDMKNERLSLACLHGVDPKEVNALLEREGIKGGFE